MGAPIGCSLDPIGNFIYWNPYRMDQTQEQLQEGATYTELGGLIHSGIVGNGFSNQIGICKDELDVSPRHCERKDALGCKEGYSCNSADAKIAQGGRYWMPCGALTIKRQSGDAHRRLCPTANIITTQGECEAAAAQFRKEWEANLKSGFQRTESTSDLQFRTYQLSDPFWQRHQDYTEGGFEPRFRAGAWHSGNSKAPIGCSLDPIGNFIYWNPYRMDQAQEQWQEGATYTELGGLIHSGIAGFGNQIGICK